MSNKITLPELKSLCKTNNIKNYSKLKKDEIIELLKKNDVKFRSEETDIINGAQENFVSSKKQLYKQTIDNSSEDTEITKISEDIEKIDLKEKQTTKKESPKKKGKEIEELDDVFDNEMIKYFIFNDEKSNKFWEIKYEDNINEKRKYIIRYGKESTPGSRTKPKMDTMKNIEKLINSKISKGYRLK